MDKLLLKNARIYLDGRFVPGGLLCADGRIAEVGAEVSAAADARTIDCGGMMLVPGFIDPHTHGGAGVDVNAATSEQLGQIGRFFASQGTTSWLCSVLTDTEEQTLWCIGQAVEAMEQRGGAQLLGIHLEGPFLAAQYKGAMPEHLLQKGSAELFRRYQRAAGGAIRYITVSPEVEGVPEMIASIADEAAVAIGHSGADYDQSMDCIAKGARSVTHTFNAMRLFHQHQPAIMGAALESDVWCEAICDGRHLHPGAVRLLLKCKGRDKVVAVTDSIMAAGLPDGRYKLGVNDVVVENGDAKLVSNGVRAGSTLTTCAALRNLVDFTGRPVEEVLPLLTGNAAAMLRIADRKGSIRPGMDADLVLLDSGLNVLRTIVGGVEVYTASACDGQA